MNYLILSYLILTQNVINDKVRCECGRGLTVQRQHCLTYDYFNDTGPFEIVVGRCIYEGAVDVGNVNVYIIVVTQTGCTMYTRLVFSRLVNLEFS